MILITSVGEKIAMIIADDNESMHIRIIICAVAAANNYVYGTGHISEENSNFKQVLLFYVTWIYIYLDLIHEVFSLLYNVYSTEE